MRKSVLCIGQSSKLARSFVNYCHGGYFDVFTVQHGDLSRVNFDNYDIIINFSFHPAFYDQQYSPENDIDLKILRSINYQLTKYVCISSRKVYGNSNTLEYFSETTLTQNTISQYGKNKKIIEANVQKIMNENFLICRVSNVVSADISGTNFTSKALRSLSSTGIITLDISDKTKRDFITDHYFAKSLYLLLLADSVGVYNIGAGFPVSIRELCDTLILGAGFGTVYWEGDVKDQFVLDCNKLQRAINVPFNKLDLLSFTTEVSNFYRIIL